MRKTASLHNTAFLLIALAVVFSTTDAFAQPLRLEKPGTGRIPFAAKQAGENAFPEDEVGLAAYVQVQETVDIQKIAAAFGDRKIRELGGDHIICVVGVENFSPTPTEINLYADTSGWIVSYIQRGELSAKAMQWNPADIKYPSIKSISRTTLSDVISAVGDSLQLMPQFWNIKYYHFKYPDANRMTIAVKTIQSKADSRTTFKQILLPSDHTFYEISYYQYTRSDVSGANTSLKVDDREIDILELPSAFKIDFKLGIYPLTLLTPGTLHTLEISTPSTYASSGLATVVIYREP